MADATDFPPRAGPLKAEKSDLKLNAILPGWRNGRRNGLKILFLPVRNLTTVS